MVRGLSVETSGWTTKIICPLSVYQGDRSGEKGLS